MLETQIAWRHISSFVVMGPVNFVLSSCTDAISYTRSEVGKDKETVCAGNKLAFIWPMLFLCSSARAIAASVGYRNIFNIRGVYKEYNALKLQITMSEFLLRES